MHPNQAIGSLEISPAAHHDIQSKHAPAQELINKALDFVLPYFKAKFPFDSQININAIQFDGYTKAKVCNSPYDTMTCALPTYSSGFKLTFKYKQQCVEVIINKNGDNIYSDVLHHDATKDIPQPLMELLKQRIKNVNGFNPADVEITHSRKKTFDKELMIETLSPHFQGHFGMAMNRGKIFIEGFECYIKCNGKGYLAAIAEDLNETRIRFEEDKPTDLQNRMKRKAEEKKVHEAEEIKAREEDECSSLSDFEEEDRIPESIKMPLQKQQKGITKSEPKDESDPELDDRGHMNKPMSQKVYNQKLAEKKLDPAVIAKIEIIQKNQVLPAEVIVKATQGIYDLLMLRYPCCEVKAADLRMIGGKWVPDFAYSKFYKMENSLSGGVPRMEFSEGFAIKYQYKDELYEIHTNMRADIIYSTDMKYLKKLPKDVCRALTEDAAKNATIAFGMLPAVIFNPENLTVLEIQDISWRNGKPGEPTPLFHGFTIAYALKNRKGLFHLVNIDLDGNIHPSVK